jgi:23S rRNA (cytosine1962-C5)-methyltransferase
MDDETRIGLRRRVAEAVRARAALLADLHRTNCVRLFHGVAEGWPGLTVDRYGDVLFVQTWRDPLPPGGLDLLADTVREAFGALALDSAAARGVHQLVPVWNHRPDGAKRAEAAGGVAPEDAVGQELGVQYDVRPRHRGNDPLLFLDFRAARRWVQQAVRGGTVDSVLNLFAYTCGMGVVAATAGASRVLNVDFAGSALGVGRRNAALNGLECDRDDPRFQTLREDVFPVVRQLAGLDVGGRRGKRPRFHRVDAEAFDLVVLDPPRWARSAWGAVDVVRDYPSLFKPALLATRVGGRVLATNHVPSVAREDWERVLRRTADKAGRPLTDLVWIEPEADFPSFDGRPPLKVAVCTVSG